MKARALAALAIALIATAALASPSAATVQTKRYTAGGGVYEGLVLDTALGCNASTGNDPPSIGGACFPVAGPGIAHITITDDHAAGPIAAFVELDGDGFFACGSAEVTLTDTETHALAVWIGGIDAVPANCVPGQATTGEISVS